MHACPQIEPYKAFQSAADDSTWTVDVVDVVLLIYTNVYIKFLIYLKFNVFNKSLISFMLTSKASILVVILYI